MIKSAFRGRDGEDVMGRPGGAQTDPWSIQTPSLWVDTSGGLAGVCCQTTNHNLGGRRCVTGYWVPLVKVEVSQPQPRRDSQLSCLALLIEVGFYCFRCTDPCFYKQCGGSRYICMDTRQLNDPMGLLTTLTPFISIKEWRSI